MTLSNGLQRGREAGLTVLGPVSRGSFGNVFYAVWGDAKTPVAFKKVSLTRGLPGRQRTPQHENEPEIQSGISHPNVVALLSYWKTDGNLCMVFEWMECNLSQFLGEVKCLEGVRKRYIYMLLDAVAYLHENHIMHRDINPRNILVASNRIIKLGDFGLAKNLQHKSAAESSFSSTAGTRQYRAPELLYGATTYDHHVDLWSCGCTCAEIWTNGSPVLFQSETDIGQLGVIVSVFGDPVQQNSFSGARDWPDYGKITFNAPESPPGLSILLPEAPVALLYFLTALLCYDPKNRIDARTALNSPYFLQEPQMCVVESLPRFGL